jgi:integrase
VGSIQNRTKPDKPYPDFPLYPHPSGRWCKTINGKKEYFGPWEDWRAALANFQAWKDDLYVGRRPNRHAQGVSTIADLCNSFLEEREARVQSGALTKRCWTDYKSSCDIVVKVLGKSLALSQLRAADYQLLYQRVAAIRKTPEALASELGRIRCIFKAAADLELVETPLRYDTYLKKPSKIEIRRARNQRRLLGQQEFKPAEIQRCIQEASQPVEAMILLAINCGFDGASCGQLVFGALNLEHQWLDFPRPKNGVSRQSPLWEETVTAIKASLATRPTPQPGHEEYVFLTHRGHSWHKTGRCTPLSQEFKKILTRAGCYMAGRGFRALRHTFRTVAAGSKDPEAVNHIMGHEMPGMGSIYTESLEPARLQAVVDHVHKWLFS